ncbi:hypothetical protein [Halorubrum trueperi]|uniref:Uncharacterized protein n=1 Tax=Halorubrum trueperi TaxID=2004704 RepID=A0ABD5UIB3_9EURY
MENTAAARLINANVRIPADFCDHSRSSPRNIPSAVATTSFATLVSRYAIGSTALNTADHPDDGRIARRIRGRIDAVTGCAIATAADGVVAPTVSSRAYHQPGDGDAYSLLYSSI